MAISELIDKEHYYYSLFFEQENENSYVYLGFIRDFNYLYNGNDYDNNGQN